MGKKILLFTLLSILLLLIFSCSIYCPDRQVLVTIPKHPWETATGQSLWYTLKWTVGDQIQSIHITGEERTIKLKIPVGETVLIAAYPLGDMCPFGGVVTPMDKNSHLTLDQNDGTIVAMLFDIDREVTCQLNYHLLKQKIGKISDDYRLIDKLKMLRDLQNGELSDISIKKVAPFGIDSFVLPDGLWISENLYNASLYVKDGLTNPVNLPEGIHRYLNKELDRILDLVVDNSGSFYSFLRQNLI